jgi:hypothetical protein
MTARCVAAVAGLAMTVVSVHPAPAQPQKTLNKCQQTAAKAMAKLVAGRSNALAKCLAKIAAEVIGVGGSPAVAADTCASALRKLVDSVNPSKTLSAKLQAKVTRACDPSVNDGLDHTVGDVIGTSGPAPEKLQARNLRHWCVHFGGAGTLVSVGQWVSCQIEAAQCEADLQVGGEYPRAIEWLGQVRPAIVALGPDPAITDALQALDEFIAGVDTNGDGRIDQRCGPVGRLASGQTAADVSADDGDLRPGSALRFVDNGDGTITDLNTGLMWEKKCDEDPPGAICPEEHDLESIYKWEAPCSVSASMRCSADADCPMGETCITAGTIWGWLAAINSAGGTGFAGYSDWRVPNIQELLTTLDFGGTPNPLPAQFAGPCTAPCDVTTCSCYSPSEQIYWSSTTVPSFPQSAWYLSYSPLFAFSTPKSIELHVRAVRGGS